MASVMINPYSEPDFMNIHDTLNYANYMFECSDFKRMSKDYIRQEGENIHIESVPDYEFHHIGKLAYIGLSGCLGDNTRDDLFARFKELSEKYTKTDIQPTNQKTVPDKTGYVVSELEGIIDDALNRKDTVKQPLSILDSIPKNLIDCDKIFKHFQSQYNDMVNYPDDYQNLDVFDYDIVKGVLNIILADIKEYVNKSAITSKQKRIRKPKKINPIQMTRSVKYLKEFDNDGLALKSLSPSKIVGSDSVWIYNTKTKSLTNFVSCDKNGLLIKGSTIYNYDPDKSCEKRLRNPINMLAELDKQGKVDQRKYMDRIKTKGSAANGRINKHCIIFKIY